MGNLAPVPIDAGQSRLTTSRFDAGERSPQDHDETRLRRVSDGQPLIPRSPVDAQGGDPRCSPRGTGFAHRHLSLHSPSARRAAAHRRHTAPAAIHRQPSPLLRLRRHEHELVSYLITRRLPSLSKLLPASSTHRTRQNRALTVTAGAETRPLQAPDARAPRRKTILRCLLAPDRPHTVYCMFYCPKKGTSGLWPRIFY